MKKWIKTAFNLIGIMGILAGCFYILYRNPKVDIAVTGKGQIFPLSNQQKLEEFNYLFEILKEGFPYFEVKKRQFGIDWLAMKDEFEEQVLSTDNDLEYYMVLKKILNQAQNGHTSIIEPGERYEEYAKLYRNSGPWNQVFNNAQVKERYAYWKDLVAENEILYIPVLFRYIEGKYVADDGYAGKELEQSGVPKGAILDSVDGLEIDKYIQSLKSQRLLAIDRIRNKPILKGLVIQAEKEVQVGITLADSTKTNLTIAPVSYSTVERNDKNPEYLFTAEIFEQFNTAYIKVPSFSYFYVNKDKAGILNFLKESANCEALIIDIRGNGGGSTNYWMNNLVAPLTTKTLESEVFLLFRNSEYLKPFMKRKMMMGIHKLKPIKDLPYAEDRPVYFENNDGVFKSRTDTVKPKGESGFSGKIYLLVDKYVFSSAEALAVFAKSTGWATLIGTDTGGDGIGFDPAVAALPHSGLIVRFPCEMGVTPDGKPNEETATTPDIYVEQKYEDYLVMVELQKNGEDIDKLENKLLYDTILRKALKEAGGRF